MTTEPIAPICFTLIHGTWARKAAWAQEDSLLATKLRKLAPGCSIHTFPWSGKNSYRARTEAAEELKRHLLQQTSISPDVHHYIVAHSHGGNVALLALRDLESIHLGGLVCLSTPFLDARRRDLGPSGPYPLIAFIIALCLYGGYALSYSVPAIVLFLLAIFYAYIGVLSDGVLVDWEARDAAEKLLRLLTPALAIVGVYTLFHSVALGLILVVVAFLALSLFTAPVCHRLVCGLMADRGVAFLSSPEVGYLQDRLYIVRLSGDEVAGFLGALQLLSTIMTRIWRQANRFSRGGAKSMELGDWMLLKTPCLGCIPIFVLALLATWVSVFTRSSTLSSVADILYALAIVVGLSFFLPFVMLPIAFILTGFSGVFASVLLPVVAACQLSFGYEAALAGAFVEVSAEPLPRGTLRVSVNQVSDTSVDVLRQSAPHDDPGLLRAIEQWVRGRLEQDRRPTST